MCAAASLLMGPPLVFMYACGLASNSSSPPCFTCATKRAALVLPIMRPELISKQVECEKASVMPRFLVLGAGIAQTCYELVVHRYSAKSGSNRVETEPLLKTLLIACAKSGAMLICLILPLRCSSGMGIVLHTTISSATEFSRRS